MSSQEGYSPTSSSAEISLTVGRRPPRVARFWSSSRLLNQSIAKRSPFRKSTHCNPRWPASKAPARRSEAASEACRRASKGALAGAGACGRFPFVKPDRCENRCGIGDLPRDHRAGIGEQFRVVLRTAIRILARLAVGREKLIDQRIRAANFVYLGRPDR